MIITGDDSHYIAFIKARLREQFLITDLGPLCYFLGIEVSSTSHGFYISEERITRISLLMLLLVMSTLLRLLWSIFMLQMVIPSMIRRTIVI
jgi:hypothetical protein